MEAKEKIANHVLALLQIIKSATRLDKCQFRKKRQF